MKWVDEPFVEEFRLLEGISHCDPTLVQRANQAASRMSSYPAVFLWGAAGDQTPENAIPLLNRALEVDSRHWPAHFLRATIYGALEEALARAGEVLAVSIARERAIEDYTKALQINPRLVQAYVNREAARDGRGGFNGAIADYTRALEINPRLVEPYVCRAFVRKSKGDLDGAIVDCTKAMQVNPKLTEAYANRAGARCAKGDIRGAIEDLHKALEVAPPVWPHRAAVEKALRILEQQP